MNINDLTITPDLLKLIAEIDEFKGSWKLLKTLSPERLQSLRYVATIESIGSSTRIEGSKLSDEAVEELIAGLETRSFSTRDEQEVAGYAEAMDLIYENHGSIPCSENYIKQLHRDLLRYSTKDERHRGNYKTHPNNVEAFDASGKSVGVIFETATPFDTPRKMQELLDWTNSALEDESLHPLIIVAVFTVVFLAIHPFQDGNGRLSRILTSLLLLKTGYNYIPYSSMESVIEKNKENYYLSLRRTQTTLGAEEIHWLPWLRFFLTSLKRQKDHLNVKLEEQARNAMKALSQHAVEVLDYLDKHERITTKQASELTDSAIPTTKNRLKKMVADGLIEAHGKGRGAFYAKAGK